MKDSYWGEGVTTNQTVVKFPDIIPICHDIPPHVVGPTPCILMIGSRNQVPRSGSEIHYPVPNVGNWYPFFTLITDETDIVMDDNE